MARQGYDLQLTRYDEKGWRATFYTTGTSTRARLWPCLAVEQLLREGRAIPS
jgi:hypothetical protein